MKIPNLDSIRKNLGQKWFQALFLGLVVCLNTESMACRTMASCITLVGDHCDLHNKVNTTICVKNNTVLPNSGNCSQQQGVVHQGGYKRTSDNHFYGDTKDPGRGNCMNDMRNKVFEVNGEACCKDYWK